MYMRKLEYSYSVNIFLFYLFVCIHSVEKSLRMLVASILFINGLYVLLCNNKDLYFIMFCQAIALFI